MIEVAKIFLSAFLIAVASWISKKDTKLAGFVTALPLTSLLALAYSKQMGSNSQHSVEYAKSIFYAVPLSLVFFLPFLFAQKLQLSFWTCYWLGIVLIGFGYAVHRSLL